jgi:hypothetical protein
MCLKPGENKILVSREEAGSSASFASQDKERNLGLYKEEN